MVGEQRIRYGDAVEEYLTYIKLVRNYSSATVTSYRSDLRLFGKYLERSILNKCLDEIDRDVIDRFITEQQRTCPMKPATIRRRGHALSSLMKYCVTKRYLPSNPMVDIQLPKKQRKMREILSEEELERYKTTQVRARKNLWRACRDKAVLDALIYTGCRRSELLGIKTTDLDLDAGTLLITQGKGSKYRGIPLCSAVKASFRSYLEQRPRAKTDYLFLASDARSRLGKNGLYKLFKRHLVRCGIQRAGITPHSMRHSFATSVIRKTNDLVSVQQLLGHADISTTSIYLHATAETMRSAIDSTF